MSGLIKLSRRAVALTRARVARGFTLIELMIVVAVIALLAAIALPAYKDSILKGKRAQGRAALIDLLQQQERYFTQNNVYLAFAAGASGTPFKTFSGDTPGQALYLLGARQCPSNPAATTFFAINECVVVYATPQNSFDTAVTELSIQSTGPKACVTDTTAHQSLCWK